MALSAELDAAAEQLQDEDALRKDWRIQFAAECVIERIFQAAEALDPARREGYFGVEALRYLRGMRNRLAHNYLDVDVETLWNTISADLPVVRARMMPDVIRATEILHDAMKDQDGEIETWRRAHLGRIDREQR